MQRAEIRHADSLLALVHHIDGRPGTISGPGARNEAGHLVALEVKAGDRVLFGKWSGTEVKVDGEELLIMKESDILGIIDHPAETKKAA
jgi:chaperonin GroES